MTNSIKSTGDGPALQITKEAQVSDLAEATDEEGIKGTARWNRLSKVRVYGFDDLLLVVDREMEAEDVAELISAAARDTGSIHLGREASLRPAGNGCMVSLPGLGPTPFTVGDRTPAHPGPGLLVITRDDPNGVRIAEDLISIRRSQLDLDGAGS